MPHAASRVLATWMLAAPLSLAAVLGLAAPVAGATSAGASDAAAQEGTRLLLVGGGHLPPAALKRFSQWAGDVRPGAPIVVVTWATAEPALSFASVQTAFAAVAKTPVVEAARAPLDGPGKAALLAQLKTAGAVFFTGGSQTRITAVLGDPEVLQAFRDAFAGGLPFGGTSAGTEVMARRMMTGNGDFTILDGRQIETVPGLGLLPAGVLVDMHFVKRKRENRLFSLLLTGPETVGLGIDQGTAVLLGDGDRIEVLGSGAVLVTYSDIGEQTLKVKVLRDGDHYHLDAK